MICLRGAEPAQAIKGGTHMREKIQAALQSGQADYIEIRLEERESTHIGYRGRDWSRPTQSSTRAAWCAPCAGAAAGASPLSTTATTWPPRWTRPASAPRPSKASSRSSWRTCRFTRTASPSPWNATSAACRWPKRRRWPRATTGSCSRPATRSWTPCAAMATRSAACASPTPRAHSSRRSARRSSCISWPPRATGTTCRWPSRAAPRCKASNASWASKICRRPPPGAPWSC